MFGGWLCRRGGRAAHHICNMCAHSCVVAIDLLWVLPLILLRHIPSTLYVWQAMIATIYAM